MQAALEEALQAGASEDLCSAKLLLDCSCPRLMTLDLMQTRLSARRCLYGPRRIRRPPVLYIVT